MTDHKEFKSFIKTVSGNEGNKCHYPTRLDTYGCGCAHNCSYCYAKSLLNFRKMWSPESPAVADTEKIRKAVSKLDPGTIVRLGGMTDCFQPIEAVYGATYETIRILNDYGIGYLIVTKSAMVAERKYTDIMRKDLAHVQISITTTDDGFCKTYEHASPPSERIKAVEKLQELGFDVAVRISPFIPQFIDYDIINSIRCDKCLVEFLRVNSWIKKWFDIDYSEYTSKQSGYQHLPLEKKKGYLSLITGFKELTVCEDVTDHYVYWKNTVNMNPDDCCNLRR